MNFTLLNFKVDARTTIYIICTVFVALYIYYMVGKPGSLIPDTPVKVKVNVNQQDDESNESSESPVDSPINTTMQYQDKLMLDSIDEESDIIDTDAWTPV